MFVLILFLVFILLTLVLANARWRLAEKIVRFKSDKVSLVYFVPTGDGRYKLGRYLFTDFSGLGDEPVWTGYLPCSVDDFVEPRYVYEDLFESETPVEGHGWVIGYRISPKLVIHSMVGVNNCWGEDEAYAFAQKYRGSFLEREEVNTLRRKWAKVSQMREAIGDGPLPQDRFWAREDGDNLTPAHYRFRIWSLGTKKCNVIMKR